MSGDIEDPDRTSADGKGPPTEEQPPASNPAPPAPRVPTAELARGAAGEEPVQRRKRKRYCEKACEACRRAKVACDDFRPCARCVSLKTGAPCIDTPAPAVAPRDRSASITTLLNADVGTLPCGDGAQHAAKIARGDGFHQDGGAHARASSRPPQAGSLGSLQARQETLGGESAGLGGMPLLHTHDGLSGLFAPAHVRPMRSLLGLRLDTQPGGLEGMFSMGQLNNGMTQPTGPVQQQAQGSGEANLTPPTSGVVQLPFLGGGCMQLAQQQALLNQLTASLAAGQGMGLQRGLQHALASPGAQPEFRVVRPVAVQVQASQPLGGPIQQPSALGQQRQPQGQEMALGQLQPAGMPSDVPHPLLQFQMLTALQELWGLFPQQPKPPDRPQ